MVWSFSQLQTDNEKCRRLVVANQTTHASRWDGRIAWNQWAVATPNGICAWGRLCGASLVASSDSDGRCDGQVPLRRGKGYDSKMAPGEEGKDKEMVDIDWSTIRSPLIPSEERKGREVQHLSVTNLEIFLPLFASEEHSRPLQQVAVLSVNFVLKLLSEH